MGKNYKDYSWDDSIVALAEALCGSMQPYDYRKYKEEEDKYVFTVALPGFIKENVEVSVKKIGSEMGTFSVTLKEDGLYNRKGTVAYYIPEDVDTEAISASLKEGVLTVTLPKFPKEKIEKAITIQ